MANKYEYTPILEQQEVSNTQTNQYSYSYQYQKSSPPFRAEQGGIKGMLTDLLDRRRARFNYLDTQRPGYLKRWTYLLLILNSIAGCLGFPLLLFISFYSVRFYLDLGVSPLSLLSVMFFGATLSVFVDVLFGFIYDRLVKLGYAWFKAVLIILGTVGLGVSVFFLFRTDVPQDEILSQFRATILVIAFCYSLANANNFKNIANLTPSQENRGRILYTEYLIKMIITLCFISTPFWTKFWSDACTCTDICANNPTGLNCNNCINNCDKTDQDDVALAARAFILVFCIINVLVALLVHPRVDATVEVIPTSFNRRIAEISRNYLLTKSFWIAVLQYCLFFGYINWVARYVDEKIIDTDTTCLKFWTDNAYMCTKAWLKQSAILLIILTSLIAFIFSYKKIFLKAFTIYFNLFLIPIGVLLFLTGYNERAFYIAIAVLFAIYFTTLPANNLLFTNGMFYDEYLSGSTQPYLCSALYNTAVKLGFFLSLAFHITLYGKLDQPALSVDADTFGLGVVFIVFTLFLIILGCLVNRYELHAFDKIHIAIERNLSDVIEVLAFYDPVEKKAIRRPVVSSDRRDRRVIVLLYNLDPRGDMKYAIYGKTGQLQSKGFLRILGFLVLAVICTVLTIVFAQEFNNAYGWLVFLALIEIPLCVFGLLYNYNVWATANVLESPNLKSSERALISKFVPLLDEKARLSVTEV